MNKNDLILISIIIVIASIYLIYKEYRPENNNQALVYYEDKLIKTLDLNVNQEISVDGYIDKVVIEVKDKMVAVKSETSPKNICSRQGFIKEGILVCLPNKIIIKLENNKIDTSI